MISMKKKNLKSDKGFTLVEMLVYLAIFLLVSTTSVTLLFSLNDLVDQYRLEAALYRSGSNVMEQILLSIRQADQVDALNTIEDSPTNGKLSVQNTSTTTEFTFSGGALNLEINGTDYGNMVNDVVGVDDFTVYQYDLTHGEFVRVRLSMTATTSASTTKSITLYGGAVVRGSI